MGESLPQRVSKVPAAELAQLTTLRSRLRELEEFDKSESFGTLERNWSLAKNLLTSTTGLDASSEHGSDTPKRFVSMLGELTKCKDCDGSCMKWKTFKENVDQMIVINRIPFSSVCNHHVVPFVGFAWIGYVPDGLLAGLSKFARVTHHFARQLQVQEKLTQDIVSYLDTQLTPKGIIVAMEAEHLCMTIRGTQTPGTTTRTVVTTGVFSDHSRTAKSEFMMGIK